MIAPAHGTHESGVAVRYQRIGTYARLQEVGNDVGTVLIDGAREIGPCFFRARGLHGRRLIFNDAEIVGFRLRGAAREKRCERRSNKKITHDSNGKS